MAEQPTIKAVLALVHKMQLQADLESARDPYASPYRPTEAGARKLCQRFAAEAVGELTADATDADVEAARALGPARAIAYLRLRHRQHHAEFIEENRVAKVSLERHAQRHRKMREVRDRERAHLNPGQRIDRAIARLRMVAAPSAAALGRQTPASERDQSPAWTVDAAQRAMSIAYRAVREIEDLEDGHKLRDMGRAA